MHEPSLLDYIKYRLAPRKYPPVILPPADEAEIVSWRESTPFGTGELNLPGDSPALEDVPTGGLFVAAEARPALDDLAGEEWRDPAHSPQSQREIEPAPEAGERPKGWPWRSFYALLLALAAQAAFAPPFRAGAAGVVMLLAALGLACWAYWRGEWPLSALKAEQPAHQSITLRPIDLGISAVFALLTFLFSSDNLFTVFGLASLALSLFFLLRACAPALVRPARGWRARWKGRIERLLHPQFHLRIDRWALVVLAAAVLILFFRLYRLGDVPPEMVSDHAEKFLDVNDILAGLPHVFFPRNGGREALQFYLVAAMQRFFGAPTSHLTLKLSTALIGLLSLPFVYLLGKEVGGRRVSLFTLLFAGLAYWTNVVSRAGMRLPFYFLFTAALLYYLVRGLRTANVKDYVLAGVFLGLGLYGYSADRILPLVVIAAVGLYLLHPESAGKRKTTLYYSLVLVLCAAVIFLPLMRYITEDPNGFLARMLARMGPTEQPLPGPAWQIFLSNLWNALRMFSISAGVVWGVSIPEYPALDIVSGALFYLGLGVALLRYLLKRHWLDLFVPLSIPLLMLPSIMALAFPSENPNLYRAGGAMVPVFLLAALALDGLMRGLEQRFRGPSGQRASWVLALLLLFWFGRQSYDLVFDKFYAQYRLSAWNYSEVGQVISDFSRTIGSPDSAWIMGYPHWLDTRLVAIEAGAPDKDYAMFVETLAVTQTTPGPRLFIINPLDQAALDALRTLYPDGWLRTYASSVPGRDFYMFYTTPD